MRIDLGSGGELSDEYYVLIWKSEGT